MIDDIECDGDVIIDIDHNLMWIADVDFESKGLAWSDAHAWCEKLQYAGLTGWRLPTSKELIDQDVSLLPDNFKNKLSKFKLWTSERATGHIPCHLAVLDKDSAAYDDKYKLHFWPVRSLLTASDEAKQEGDTVDLSGRTYDENGFDIDGFDKNDLHKTTKNYYDPLGYDVKRCDKRGFNKYGIHHLTHNKFGLDGYDRLGFDYLGFNTFDDNSGGTDPTYLHFETGERFDQRGFYLNGEHRDTGTDYDPDGFDIHGFSKNGINRDTGDYHDRRGYFFDGIHCQTYTDWCPEGYSRNGENFNWKYEGYDEDWEDSYEQDEHFTGPDDDNYGDGFSGGYNGLLGELYVESPGTAFEVDAYYVPDDDGDWDEDDNYGDYDDYNEYVRGHLED